MTWDDIKRMSKISRDPIVIGGTVTKNRGVDWSDKTFSQLPKKLPVFRDLAGPSLKLPWEPFSGFPSLVVVGEGGAQTSIWSTRKLFEDLLVLSQKNAHTYLVPLKLVSDYFFLPNVKNIRAVHSRRNFHFEVE